MLKYVPMGGPSEKLGCTGVYRGVPGLGVYRGVPGCTGVYRGYT